MKVETPDRWLFIIYQAIFIGLHVLCKTVTSPALPFIRPYRLLAFLQISDQRNV